MAEARYKRFNVTGIANTEALDSGMTSSTAEKYRILGLFLYVSGWIDNIIIAYHESTKKLEIPDYLVHTDESSGSTNVQKSVSVERFFPVDLELPVGQTFKVGISCGGTAKNLKGSYKYEVVS
jgi:hypothetical protein